MELDLGDVAHGGYVVGRHQGKVIFTTGGLPGERVRVRVTEQGKRFDRAEVVEVLSPHSERVEPPCPIAGVCGGCDWQHASQELQLELKRRVVAEQLRRLAGIEWDGNVEPVAPVWGWRTRMRYGGGERLGLRAKRSHIVVPLPAEGCRIASSAAPDVVGEQIEVVEASSGRTVIVDGRVLEGEATVKEHAGGRTYAVGADGFWQVHPLAAETLLTAVMQALDPKAGEHAIDLYCGVGLFAGALASAGCEVLGVEANRNAVRHARNNVPEAQFQAASVERFLDKLPRKTDLVVLDPPRKGAGKRVVEAVARMNPRGIAYVACDPAALARDLAHFEAVGYKAMTVRAFDLFPQTYHIESVATIRPS